MATVINITPEEAHGLIFQNKAVVLDVRESYEFLSGHIPNAINVPVSMLDQLIESTIRNKKTPIIVHCFAGSRSPIAVNILVKHGYENIYHMSTGINAWHYGLV